MIACILLAAGLSTRFGSSKALAQLNGKTVIAHLQHTLTNSLVDEIIIVLGAFHEDVKSSLLKHEKVKPVYNKDHNFGQTSSFKKGLRAVSPNTLGVLLVPVDVPLIQTATINTLISTFLEDKPLVLIPSYKGKKGHPPLFHKKLIKEFLALNDKDGINTIAHQHPSQVCLLPVQDSGTILSFNTQEELLRIKDYYTHKRHKL